MSAGSEESDRTISTHEDALGAGSIALTVLKRSARIFKEARRGQWIRLGTLISGAADMFDPWIDRLHNYPLNKVEARRSILLARDQEAATFNSTKVLTGQKRWHTFFTLSCLSVVIGLAFGFLSVIFGWLRWTMAMLTLLGSLLLAWAFGKIAALMSVKPKLRFYKEATGERVQLNFRCPGCLETFSSQTEISKRENEAYSKATEKVQFWSAFSHRVSLDNRYQLIFEPVQNAANYIAKMSYRLPYLCEKCAIQFCSACTGGPIQERHFCPDCGELLTNTSSIPAPQSDQPQNDSAAGALVPSGTPSSDAFVKDCLEVHFREVEDNRDWHAIEGLHALNQLVYHEGSAEEAIRLTNEYLGKYPDFHPLYIWLGDARARLRQPGEPQATYREGLQKSHSKVSLCSEMGNSEFEANKLPEAVKWWLECGLLQFSVSRCSNAFAFVNLAYIAEGLGLKAEQVALLQQADSVDNPTVRFNASGADQRYRLAREQGDDSIRSAIRQFCAVYLKRTRSEESKESGS